MITSSVAVDAQYIAMIPLDTDEIAPLGILVHAHDCNGVTPDGQRLLVSPRSPYENADFTHGAKPEYSGSAVTSTIADKLVLIQRQRRSRSRYGILGRNNSIIMHTNIVKNLGKYYGTRCNRYWHSSFSNREALFARHFSQIHQLDSLGGNELVVEPQIAEQV
jgi:hypothetical protein